MLDRIRLVSCCMYFAVKYIINVHFQICTKQELEIAHSLYEMLLLVTVQNLSPSHIDNTVKFLYLP